MKSLIARWYIKPGEEDKVWPVLEALPAKVLAEEPDTYMYLVHKPDTEASMPPLPGTEIIFFEAYKDEGAFTAHIKGKVFTTFVEEYGDCFLSPFASPHCVKPANFVVIESLDRLGGFVRKEATGLLA